MFARLLTTASVVAALALAPAERAEADAADFIGGAIIGGVIGHALTQQGNTRTTTTTTRTVRPSRPSIPVTQQGRQTQTALNYFGFNAGRVDGQVGPGTRGAIERYQAAMGFPINGRQFSDYQFSQLMDAYYWATNVGATQTGLRGQALLIAYRDQTRGGGITTATAPPTTVIVQQPAPAQSVAPPPTTVVTPAPSQTVTVASTQAAPQQLPNLFANASPGVSLANSCNTVMLQTSSNGGYMTLASMTDPDHALSEQFCVARSYAMARGEELMQSIVGLTQDQITEQCASFSTMLSSEIDRVSIAGQAELEPEMREFALGTGIAPVDLASTARVCLAVGYAQDDMRMAVGSALLLAALGETAYGELLGHHLREGFGTVRNQNLAMGWYEASLGALERGAVEPAFMPGQPERTQLVRAATERLGSGVLPTPVPAAQPAPAAALPTFTVNQ